MANSSIIAFKVEVSGADITPAIGVRLLSISVEDKSSFASERCALEFDDADGGIVVPRTGDTLELSIGYIETGLVRMGAYAVDSVTLSGPPRRMRITAKAADLNPVPMGMKTPVTRSWDATSLGAIVETIAREQGLVPMVDEGLAERAIPHVRQTNESPMHFLTRLLGERGGTFKIADRRLLAVVRRGDSEPSGDLVPELVLTAADISTWSVTLSARRCFAKVAARWRDAQTAEERKVVAGEGAPGETVTLTQVYASRQEAEAAAEERRRVMLRSGDKLMIQTAIGQPGAFAEGNLELSGIREGVDGQWRITKVSHSLNSEGYTTRIEAETYAVSVAART